MAEGSYYMARLATDKTHTYANYFHSFRHTEYNTLRVPTQFLRNPTSDIPLLQVSHLMQFLHMLRHIVMLLLSTSCGCGCQLSSSDIRLELSSGHMLREHLIKLLERAAHVLSLTEVNVGEEEDTEPAENEG